MSGTPEPRPPRPRPEPGAGSGLSLRLWIACLGASVFTALALAWIAGDLATGAAVESLVPRWFLVLGLAFGIAAALAFWISRSLDHRIRRLSRAALEGHMPEGAASRTFHGWGEIARLADRLAQLLERQRHLRRGAEELAQLRAQITIAQESIAAWVATERWQSPPLAEGALNPLVQSLDRGFARDRDVAEQNQEAARQVRDDLALALQEARGAAEHAEIGFVEATALLTTVRELQRLGGELKSIVLTPEPAPAAAPTDDGWRAAAAEAVNELVSASGASVEHLGNGLLKVHEISEQVQLLSNRATLIALTAMISAGRAGQPEPGPKPAEELKELARDVRAATERVAELTLEIEREAVAATARMHEVRDRVARRLDEMPQATTPAAATPLPGEEVVRLLDRVREMIQDAMRKGERLSASGEHASRSAEKVARRLEEEIRDVEGVIVRLAAPGDPQLERQKPAPGVGSEGTPRGTGLRVLERRDDAPGESPRMGREPRP